LTPRSAFAVARRPPAAAARPQSMHSGRFRRAHAGRLRVPLFGHLLGDSSDRGVLAIDNGANGITEVAQQVPAVSNLNSIGGSLAHAALVDAGAVACNHLDAWVLPQPGGQRFGLPVCQEVHNLVALQVDQDGAVAVAAAPSPIINGKNSRRRRRRLAGDGRCRHTQQRIGADRHGKPLSKSCSGFAAKRERHMTLQTAEPLRATSRNEGHIVEALGECSAGTGGIHAPEPPGSDLDRHRPTLPRQIAQLSQVTAMDRKPAHKPDSLQSFGAVPPQWSHDPARQHTQNLQRAWNKGKQGRRHKQSTMDVNPLSLPDSQTDPPPKRWTPRISS
jgi:hypothetical protein